MKSKHKNVPKLETMQLALKSAELIEVPEAATERALIRELWPEFHALHAKGISFIEIAALLNMGLGFSISRLDLEITYREIVCEQWEKAIEELRGIVETFRARSDIRRMT